MNRKLCLLTLAIVILAVLMGSVQAAVNTWITVNTPYESVPLNTPFDVTVHYDSDSTNPKPVGGILIVWYRTGSSGSWTPKEMLLAKIITQNPYEKIVPYTFEKPGYYKFTWTVLKTLCETKTVHVTVGPVVPEPGTLLGLAVSVAVLGLVFNRKRLTK